MDLFIIELRGKLPHGSKLLDFIMKQASYDGIFEGSSARDLEIT
jgi:hypothetical protein